MEVTLLTENTRIRYTGDGVLKEFSYPFNPIDLSYVKVYKNLQPVTAPDVTISSGVVTFNTAPAEGDSIVIIREKPLTYDSGIVSKGIISPDSLDNLAVELLGQIQQVNEKLDRVPVYPIDTTMTGEEILNQFNQDVQTVKDSRVEVEGKAEEINSTVSSGLTEISNATSESKSQITEEKNTSISEIQRVTEGLIDRAEVAADESESWANKAESFANQANLDSIRTNCLTAIPQDIKLELNNGTLTLKAGSKVYKGDGSPVSVNSDIVVKYGGNLKNLVVFPGTSGTNVVLTRIEYCYSGTTPPSQQPHRQFWYDTVNRKVYTYAANSVEGVEVCLPIAVVDTLDDNKFSVKEVFNGFGYIGGTRFTLGSGVKVLAPNGRNTDGSLNSIEYTLKFSIYSNHGNNNTIYYTDGNGINNYGPYYEQSEKPSTKGLWYNPDDNYMRLSTDNGATWTIVKQAFIGIIKTDSTGRITSFNPKTVFQATDYYDFKQLDDSAAKLDENNIFTGINTFESANSNVYIKSSSIDITSIPSSTRYSYIDFYDKNSKRIGVIGTFQFTTGEYGIYLQAGNVAALNIRTNGTNSYTSVATPPTTDNSTQIATTAWVRQVAALKDLSNTGLTAGRAIITDGSGKVSVSAVTSTELGYLDGVTSSIQTQLNGKQAAITGGASTITGSNLTANRALISNGSGKVAVSAVTSTELGYLDGVTSAIQTQLNAKQAAGSYANTSLSNVVTTVGLGYVYIGKLLIQWGSLKAIKDTEVTVTFPKPFSNSNYFIGKNIGSLGSGAPSDNRASFYNLTTTSAKTRQEDVYTYARWLAIGQGV